MDKVSFRMRNSYVCVTFTMNRILECGYMAPQNSAERCSEYGGEEGVIITSSARITPQQQRVYACSLMLLMNVAGTGRGTREEKRSFETPCQEQVQVLGIVLCGMRSVRPVGSRLLVRFGVGKNTSIIKARNRYAYKGAAWLACKTC